MTACRLFAVLSWVVLLGSAPAAGEFRMPKRPVPEDMPAAVRGYVLRLQSDSAVTRGNAALKLEEMQARAAPAVPFLRDMLPDDTPVDYVVSFGSTQWESPTTTGIVAGKAIWNIRPDEFADILQREGEIARYHAIRSLAGYARQYRALRPILLGIKDASANVRYAAARCLSNTKHPEAVSALRDALTDSAAPVRAVAVSAMGKAQDAESFRPLLSVLAGDRDEYPRGLAAYYLGEYKDKHAVAPLLQVLADRSAYVRGHAASSLGMLADPKAIGPLLKLTHDPDEQVRRDARAALRCFNDPEAAAAMVADLDAQDWRDRSRAVAALGRHPDRFTRELIHALQDARAAVAQEAIEALGWTDKNAAQAAEALVDRLQDTDRSVKLDSVFASLERLGSAAVRPLERVLRSPPKTIRFGRVVDYAPHAARSLANIGTAEAMQALRRGATSPSAKARAEVKHLGRRPTLSVPRRRPKRPPPDPEALAMRRPPPRLPASARTAAAQPAPSAGEGPATGDPRFRLSGVIGGTAIINGKPVGVGATVNGAKVVKIGATHVELEADGERLIVRM